MVHINGKDIDAAGQSLAAYLKANDYEMGTFVVECNEEIIHKEDYENYMLKDGDIIEIVQFMGGWLRYISDVSLHNVALAHLRSKFFMGRCSRWYISDVSLP